jgi:16S rRNA processing protein RimM
VTLAPFASIPPGLAPTVALNPATVPHPPQQGPEAQQERLRPPTEPTEYRMESARLHNGQMLITLAGVETADQAEALRGYWVTVPTAQAKKLPRGSYYLYQLAGLEVYTTEGQQVGKIEEILTGAANDVYVVRGPGVTDPTGELLVPAIKQVVKRIELSRGRIIIEPPAEWA